MPDLRYHLISLISVFLAIAIGILLGVAVADRGVVTERLEEQISDIQNRFADQQRAIDERNRQIDRLQEETARDEELMAGMYDAISSGRLIGLEVAVVSGPYADDAAVNSVLDALDGAGAEVTTVEELPQPTPSEVTAPSGETTPLQLEYLETAELVASESGDADSPPQVVIFVGGGEIPPEAPSGALEAINEAQAEIFDLWTDSAIKVIGVEPRSAGRSEIELYQSAGLASVDNVDTPAGRAAVVVLAASDLEGSYGVKATASEPFPVPE